MTSGWFLLIEPIMKKGYDIICECMAAKYFNRKKKIHFFLFRISPLQSEERAPCIFPQLWI